MSHRAAELERKTNETEVKVAINLDGHGRSEVSTGVPFFDHMLELFSRHGLFTLGVEAKGDLQVDMHHTVEDVGIVLGKMIAQSLGDKKGIRRYGHAICPMDEAMVEATLDISGRGHLELHGTVPEGAPLSPSLLEGFLQAVAANAALTLHVDVRRGRDAHHVVEAVFKALGRALRAAVELDPRIADQLPTTKGVL